jgi:hypothetical protein
MKAQLVSVFERGKALASHNSTLIATCARSSWIEVNKWFRENCSLIWFLIQLTCLGVIYLIYKKWPTMPVGFAIGAAGVVAATMTVRDGRWKVVEKFLWIVIIAGLWAMDVHNIFREQKTHDAEQKLITDSLKDTQGKLADAQGRLADTQNKLSAAISQLDVINQNQGKTLNLATDNLNQLTGGKSWIEIMPSRTAVPLNGLTVFVHGQHPFYGQTLEIYDSSGLHRRRSTYPFPAPESLIAVVPLPTYYPGWAYPLNVPVPVTNERTQMFEFRIIGKYGMIQEWMKLSLSPVGGWSVSAEVHKGKQLLNKWADPKFPNDWQLEPPTTPLDPKLEPNP